jgi:hypothetical protein
MLRLARLLCLLIGLVLSIGIANQAIKAEGYFILLVMLMPVACLGAARFFFRIASDSGLR